MNVFVCVCVCVHESMSVSVCVWVGGGGGGRTGPVCSMHYTLNLHSSDYAHPNVVTQQKTMTRTKYLTNMMLHYFRNTR